MKSSTYEHEALEALKAIRDQYLAVQFDEIAKLTDEPSILATAKRENAADPFWWIEWAPIQEWSEGDARVIQFSLDLRSEATNFSTVIEAYEDGRPSTAGAIWQIKDGIPSRQLDESSTS
jgi:hypothetical protein